MTAWPSCNIVGRINKVIPRPARTRLILRRGILLQYFCSTSPLFISRVCRDCSLHNKMKNEKKMSDGSRVFNQPTQVNSAWPSLRG